MATDLILGVEPNISTWLDDLHDASQQEMSTGDDVVPHTPVTLFSREGRSGVNEPA